jgi:hypothetical protein
VFILKILKGECKDCICKQSSELKLKKTLLAVNPAAAIVPLVVLTAAASVPLVVLTSCRKRPACGSRLSFLSAVGVPAKHSMIKSLQKYRLSIPKKQIRFHGKLLTNLHFFYLIIFEELLPTIDGCCERVDF